MIRDGFGGPVVSPTRPRQGVWLALRQAIGGSGVGLPSPDRPASGSAVPGGKRIRLVPAVWGDYLRLRRLRNHPATYRWMGERGTGRPVGWLEHWQWMREMLSRPDRHLYMVRDALTFRLVGTAHVEVRNLGEVGISVTVAPRHRGKGYGLRIVRSLAKEWCTYDCLAEIQHENRVSQELFMAAGFKREGLTVNGKMQVMALRRRLK